MTVYYLNANPIGVPDGLNPSTGYPNLSTLLQTIALNPGDVINFVDNGAIDDSAGPIEDLPNSVPTGITFQSYSGNINKPTWILYPVASYGGEDSLNIQYFGDSTPTQFFDLNIIGTTIGSYIGSDIYFESDLSPFIASRCIFNQVTPAITASSILVSITDCVFISVTGQYKNSSLFLNPYLVASIYINNNVFYGGDIGIYIFGGGVNLTGIILNNIFDGEGTNCIDLDGTITVISLLIDYNNTFGVVTEFGGSQWSDTYLGIHNVRNTDPKFTNPLINDFTLQSGSPCISAGIGNNAYPSVPLVDFNNISIDSNNPDIGAFKFISSTTTSAPGTTTTYTNSTSVSAIQNQVKLSGAMTCIGWIKSISVNDGDTLIPLAVSDPYGNVLNTDAALRFEILRQGRDYRLQYSGSKTKPIDKNLKIKIDDGNWHMLSYESDANGNMTYSVDGIFLPTEDGIDQYGLPYSVAKSLSNRIGGGTVWSPFLYKERQIIYLYNWRFGKNFNLGLKWIGELMNIDKNVLGIS